MKPTKPFHEPYAQAVMSSLSGLAHKHGHKPFRPRNVTPPPVSVSPLPAGHPVAPSPKSRDDHAFLHQALLSHYFFKQLQPSELESIVQAMHALPDCGAGTTLQRSGDVCKGFYLIERGSVDVLHGGEVVQQLGPGAFVGEPSLLFNSPCDVTAVVTSPSSRMWWLSTHDYRSLIASTSESLLQETRECLHRVPFLSELDETQFERLAQSVIEVQYHRDDVIVKKGDYGDAMFIIKEGSVTCKNIGFGEQAVVDRVRIRVCLCSGA
jgi:cAMP-dependent protein kinase regulator